MLAGGSAAAEAVAEAFKFTGELLEEGSYVS